MKFRLYAGLTALVTVVASLASTPASARTLNGCELAPYTTCKQVDLSYSNLQYSNLENSNFMGSHFDYANLQHVNFQHSELLRATLTGADLTGANLSDANLDRVVSGRLVGIPMNLPYGWKLVNGYLVGAGADLRGADLADADLTGADFRMANLDGADLARANLAGARGCGVVGTPVELPLGWKIKRGCLIGRGVTLIGEDLAGSDLRGSDLREVEFIDVDLNGVDLSGVDLTGAYLRNVDLSGVDLTNVNLTGVLSSRITGTGATFPLGWQLIKGHIIGPEADLSGVDLSAANLSGANLSHAKLVAVSSGNIVGEPESLPEEWHLVKGYLIGPEADLSGADLSGADLKNLSLAKTDLSDADLSGANLAGISSGGITGTPSALPDGWGLIGGYLIGAAANLARAALHGTDMGGLNLSGVNFEKADLSDVNLEGTQLIGANLTAVLSGGITGTPAALPKGWKLLGGFLIGRSVNLAEVDLQDQNLSGLDLEGVNLIGANLSGVSSGAITGNPASLPAEWKLMSGYLIGPGANLSGASLVNLDLNGANLTGAEITGADLRGANLLGVVSGQISGFPKALPAGWQLIDGALKQLPRRINLTIKILGTAKVSKTISVYISGSSAILLRNKTLRSTYQWLQDGKPLKNSTKPSLKLTAAMKNHKISVRVATIGTGYSNLVITVPAVKVS